jgi:hypothetical protein
MKNILIIIGVILSLSTYSQEKISPDKLRKDIDFLIRKYEKVHPNLYIYTDKKRFNLNIDELKSEITDSLTSLDFWIKLAPIINGIKDGHTSVSPNYKDVGSYSKKFNASKYQYLPFSVFIIDSVIYLRETYGENSTSIKVGAIIKSINGHSSSEIIKKLVDYKSGERFAYRLYYAQRTFLWDFTMFYPSEKYKVEYIENGILKTANLIGILEDETNAYSSKVFSELPDYAFNLVDKNIGYLEYNECHDYEKFRALLDSSFTVIRQNGIKNLIIDIRKNGGGDSGLNDLLLSYLYNKPFNSYNSINVKVTDDIRELNDFYKQFPKDTIISLDTYKRNTPINSLLYDGKVYLLTSTFTFSSGTDCAMLFKDYNIGIIVGQETGGLPSGYGDTFSFKLPYSGLNARVSYKYFIRPSGINDKSGVIPDISIRYLIDDLLTAKDLEMDYLLKRINGE